MGVRGVQERPLIPAEGMCPVRHRHLWNNEVLHHSGVSGGRTADFSRGGGGQGKWDQGIM
jgi:hypothetical protein